MQRRGEEAKRCMGEETRQGMGEEAMHSMGGGDKARQRVGGNVIHAGLRQGKAGGGRQSNAWGGGKAKHGGKQGKA